MSVPTNDPGPIGQIRSGMQVVDSDGEKVGSVEDVRMGDPDAVTSDGQEQSHVDDVMSAAVEAVTVRGFPPEADRERMERLGYVRIDAAGLFGGSKYVTSDQVAGVEGDVVHLSVPGSHAI